MRPKEKYVFTISDIATLTEQDPNTIRQHIHRKKFNPNELGSVVEYINNQRDIKPIGIFGYIQLIEKEANENIFNSHEEPNRKCDSVGEILPDGKVNRRNKQSMESRKTK